MHPRLRHGDLLLVVPAGPVCDDVVVWAAPFGLAVHRVAEELEMNGTRYLRTRGDANASLDRCVVPTEDVLGVVRLRARYLGLPSLLCAEIRRALSGRTAERQLNGWLTD